MMIIVYILRPVIKPLILRSLNGALLWKVQIEKVRNRLTKEHTREMYSNEMAI